MPSRYTQPSTQPWSEYPVEHGPIGEWTVGIIPSRIPPGHTLVFAVRQQSNGWMMANAIVRGHGPSCTRPTSCGGSPTDLGRHTRISAVRACNSRPANCRSVARPARGSRLPLRQAAGPEQKGSIVANQGATRLVIRGSGRVQARSGDAGEVGGDRRCNRGSARRVLSIKDAIVLWEMLDRRGACLWRLVRL